MIDVDSLTQFGYSTVSFPQPINSHVETLLSSDIGPFERSGGGLYGGYSFDISSDNSQVRVNVHELPSNDTIHPYLRGNLSSIHTIAHPNRKYATLSRRFFRLMERYLSMSVQYLATVHESTWSMVNDLRPSMFADHVHVYYAHNDDGILLREHVDPGMLTLLYTTSPGLQVKRGSVFVNIPACTWVLLAGRLLKEVVPCVTSCIHRVLSSVPNKHTYTHEWRYIDMQK